MTIPSLSAARMDLQCTTSALDRAAYWMRVHAGVPQSASVWYAHTVLTRRADGGDRTAVRTLRRYMAAAVAYETARVAVAELELAAEEAA